LFIVWSGQFTAFLVLPHVIRSFPDNILIKQLNLQEFFSSIVFVLQIPFSPLRKLTPHNFLCYADKTE